MKAVRTPSMLLVCPLSVCMQTLLRPTQAGAAAHVPLMWSLAAVAAAGVSLPWIKKSWSRAGAVAGWMVWGVYVFGIQETNVRGVRTEVTISWHMCLCGWWHLWRVLACRPACGWAMARMGGGMHGARTCNGVFHILRTYCVHNHHACRQLREFDDLLAERDEARRMERWRSMQGGQGGKR